MSRVAVTIDSKTPSWVAAVAVKKRRTTAIVSACILFVTLIGFLDYATGIDLRIYPFYYLPIAIGAYSISRRFGLLLAAISSALWALAIQVTGIHWSTGIYIFNTLTQSLSFGLIALLISNIAARLAAERELSREDNLTALPNRRAFYEFAEIIIAQSRRSGRPFTLAYIDLDNFKVVNDRKGHQQGDLALRTAAEVLRNVTRASDISARLGGDEFAPLLPDSGCDAANVVLDRVSKRLEETMQRNEWPITASIGATSFVHAPDSVEYAVRKADMLMYRVKESGKGHVLLEVSDGGDA